MTLGEYMDERGLHADDLAALLNERIPGKSYSRVHIQRERPMPKAWAAALGVSAASETTAPDAPKSSPDDGREHEQPPRPPSDAKIAPPPPGLRDIAAERIASTYGLLGFALATVAENPGVGKVFDDCSPSIARAWLAAAEENEFARRVVRLMGSGGATGELVVTHVVLLGGVLYVSGRIPDAAGIFAKWAPYRVVPQAEPDEADPNLNGSSRPGAGASVGDVAGSSQA